MKKLLTCLILLSIISACQQDASSLVAEEAFHVIDKPRQMVIGQQYRLPLSGETPDSINLGKGLSYDQAKHELLYQPQRSGVHQLEAVIFDKGNRHQLKLNLKAVAAESARDLDYQITETLEHNPLSYTQGLEFHSGQLYESSGNYGISRVLHFGPDLRDEKHRFDFPDEIFAEGLSWQNGRLTVLSWQEKKAFHFNEKLELLDEQSHPLREGWGLCKRDNGFWASDGSHHLFRLDSLLQMQGLVEIYNGNRKLEGLNELEYTDQGIWANVYHDDRIYLLDPATGTAKFSLDLSPLREKLANRRAEVLNGIAWHPEKRQLLVTGKYWDKAFWLKIGEEVL